MELTVARHYDNLIKQQNDPVLDPPALRTHMNGWDGALFLDRLPLSQDKSVLEIGVGTGRLALRVAPHCGSFCGIDLSPCTVARAREHLGVCSHASLICADFLTHAFHNTFDIIYSSLTFFHIKEKRQALTKVFSLLRANGFFALSIDKNQADTLRFDGYSLPLYPDDPDQTRALLCEVGFSVVEEIEVDFAYLFFCKK